MDSKSLGKIGDLLLESSSFRKSFQVDPIGAAAAAGIRGPSTTEVDLLTTLSQDDLEKLAQIREKLVGANPSFGAAAADITGGILF